MDYKIRIAPLAINDIKAIVEYIKLDDEDIAKEIGNKLYGAIDSLITLPNRGANLSTKIAAKTDFKFILSDNYMIVYRVQDDYVSVYRVFDVRRDYKTLI